MVITTVIDDFLDDLEKIKRYSGNTVKSYRRDLAQFGDYCREKNKTDIENINEKLIRSYTVILSQNKKQASSISRKLSAIRSLFSFALKNDIILSNPASGISNPKITRKLPEVASVEILDNISEDLKENDLKMYRTIFEVLYCCALRVSELCSLNINDIDFDNMTIRILGKGSKVRITPVGKESTIIIKEYLRQRNNWSFNSPLFVTTKGERIYPRYVYRIINTYLKKQSDLKKKSPHVLRHTAATHMLDNGADLMAVKEILGHESLSTTQIYTHVSIERLKKTHKLAHPKS